MTPLFYREKIDFNYSPKSYLILAVIVLMGIILRFWGLGNVGLHGDEETMAMPALSILESGTPHLPSGMLYVRGIGQLYLMAFSVWLFGVSEWALRFPSAVVGSMGVLIAFFLGKRFLNPHFNLLFVLTIALYPLLITFSQTARMYIFIVTFLMLYAVFLFRWEENDTWKNLALTFITFIVSLHFHLLTIFSVFLFFYPFLMRPSKKRFLQSGLAFTLSGFIFLAYRYWIRSNYFVTISRQLKTEPAEPTLFNLILSNYPITATLLLALSLLIVFTIIRVRNNKHDLSIPLISKVFFLGAIAACFFFQYYAGSLLFVCGAIFHIRSNAPKKPMLIMLGFIAGLFLTHFVLFYNLEEYSSTKDVLKALAGVPSPRIMFTFFKEFPFASAVYFFPLVYAIMRMSSGSTIPDHFLFFVISVWVPLLCVGFFKWSVPIRYISMVIPFLVLSIIGGYYYLNNNIHPTKPAGIFVNKVLLPLVLVIAIINPVELKSAVNPGYDRFPDHIGAAAYMRTVELGQKDIVVAEDVLQMTYYLGKVDYWLYALDVAKTYVREHAGMLVRYIHPHASYRIWT